MAATGSRDPYRNFRYSVEIVGVNGSSGESAGFSKVSGLKQTVEVISYREGGFNDTTHKLPGQTTFDAITLERGLSKDTTFLNWIQEIYTEGLINNQGSNDGFRKDLTITLKDKAGAPVYTWTCMNCWPSEKSVADLDAAGNDVLIESLVLQTEGIKEVNLSAT